MYGDSYGLRVRECAPHEHDWNRNAEAERKGPDQNWPARLNRVARVLACVCGCVGHWALKVCARQLRQILCIEKCTWKKSRVQTPTRWSSSSVCQDWPLHGLWLMWNWLRAFQTGGIIAEPKSCAVWCLCYVTVINSRTNVKRQPALNWKQKLSCGRCRYYFYRAFFRSNRNFLFT